MTGFAIVNLNFMVSRIINEKYIIPFILARALLPFFSLVITDILSNIESNSDSISYPQTLFSLYLSP